MLHRDDQTPDHDYLTVSEFHDGRTVSDPGLGRRATIRKYSYFWSQIFEIQISVQTQVWGVRENLSSFQKFGQLF